MGLQDQIHYIHDQKWYPYFVPHPTPGLSVLDDFPLGSLRGKLCISFCVRTTLGQTLRLFSVFDSYLDFAEYQLKFPEDKRSFFEYVLGQYTQKPRFDIDVSGVENLEAEGERLKDLVIESACRVLLDKGVTVNLGKQVGLFTSHGPTKRSYHIVFIKLCHLTNADARDFYELVVGGLSEADRKFVDMAVYGKKQQFRCLGSQKLGSARPKVFCEEWSFKGTPIRFEYEEPIESEQHRYLTQMELSLLSLTVRCCILPAFKVNSPVVRPMGGEDPEITHEDAYDALKMYATSRGSSVNHPGFPYRLGKVNGAFVVLKRIRMSNCPLCNRAHEHENPFLTIAGPLKTVFYNCRRSKKSLRVGDLVDIVSEWLDETIESLGGETSTQIDLEEALQVARMPSAGQTSPMLDSKKTRRKFMKEALANLRGATKAPKDPTKAAMKAAMKDALKTTTLKRANRKVNDRREN